MDVPNAEKSKRVRFNDDLPIPAELQEQSQLQANIESTTTIIAHNVLPVEVTSNTDSDSDLTLTPSPPPSSVSSSSPNSSSESSSNDDSVFMDIPWLNKVSTEPDDKQDAFLDWFAEDAL